MIVLEIDYSRAPCLSADQTTRGLWERDYSVIVTFLIISATSVSRILSLSGESTLVTAGNMSARF